MQSLGLTNLAASGFDMLMPVLSYEKVQAWCSIAGVGVAPLESVNAFTRLTNPLAELQGINAYWKGKEGKTPEEERTYQTVLDNLDKARADWDNLELPDDLRGAVLTLIEAGLQGEFPLADATAKLLQGERTSTIEIFETLLLDLTLFDCFLVALPLDIATRKE
jgi:hypothetical protein